MRGRGRLMVGREEWPTAAMEEAQRLTTAQRRAIVRLRQDISVAISESGLPVRLRVEALTDIRARRKNREVLTRLAADTSRKRPRLRKLRRRPRWIGDPEVEDIHMAADIVNKKPALILAAGWRGDLPLYAV